MRVPHPYGSVFRDVGWEAICGLPHPYASVFRDVGWEAVHNRSTASPLSLRDASATRNLLFRPPSERILQ